MERKNIMVRLGNRNDINTIVKFNAEMALETENISLSTEKLQKGVTGLFNDPQRGFYVVAEWDGKVVGQTMITYEWSDWRNANFWWIQSVYVMPEYRGFGVFRSIFEYIKNKAKESSDVCGFRLYVSKYNVQAKRTYESMGMEMSYYEMFEMPISV